MTNSFIQHGGKNHSKIGVFLRFSPPISSQHKCWVGPNEKLTYGPNFSILLCISSFPISYPLKKKAASNWSLFGFSQCLIVKVLWSVCIHLECKSHAREFEDLQNLTQDLQSFGRFCDPQTHFAWNLDSTSLFLLGFA